jgi:hypothetical protein
MERLILTTDHAGAGCLNWAKAADRVYAVAHHLLSEPPSAISDEFFAPAHRADRADAPHWTDVFGVTNDEPHRPGLLEECRRFDIVELWVDPTPKALLILLQLLDFLGNHEDVVRRLILCFADRPFGELKPDEIAAWRPAPHPVGPHHLDTARLAWQAFRQPTPEAWFRLLPENLNALPPLRRSVLALLDELPAVGTALGATERLLLQLVSPAGPVPFLAPDYRKVVELGVFDYWEVGQLLDRLAHCPHPAILGLEEGPFDLALHDDKERYLRYRGSRLSLSDLGRALAQGRDDFARYNPVYRWWGGTELTNDRLWRWDAVTQALIPPA